jgi:predicted ester cyclase
MADELIAEVMDRHLDGWNRRDAQALCHDHAEDGVIVSPMFARVQGRPQICGSYAALFTSFPDWQIRFEPPIVSGLRLAVYFSVAATHQGEFRGLAGTGRRCTFEGVSLLELGADLLIREERRFYDFTGLLMQLGVSGVGCPSR